MATSTSSKSSSKPWSDYNEEVLGPAEDVEQGIREEDEEEDGQEEPLSQSMILLAIGKIRGFMEDKLQHVIEHFQKQVGDLTKALQEAQEEVKSLRDSQTHQKYLQTKSLEDTHAHSLRVGSLEKSLESHLKALRQELLDVSASHAKATERWLNKRLEGLSGLQGDHLESLHKMFEMGVGAAEERFKGLLTSLPVPQVHFSVPEAAIKMEQLPSQVTVHVPQQSAPVVENKFLVPQEAFKFHVEQPPAQVILPEKALQVHVNQAAAPPVIISEKAFEVKAPEVHISVPEQTPPDVIVNTPRRKVIKSIEYDEQSRPKHIVEEEIMEEG